MGSSQSHTIHRAPLGVNGRSQRRTDVCSHEQPSLLQALMVYPNPEDAHESSTGLHLRRPAPQTNDELCLSCRATRAMEINQLLFQTVGHQCDAFSSWHLLKYSLCQIYINKAHTGVYVVILNIFSWYRLAFQSYPFQTINTATTPQIIFYDLKYINHEQDMSRGKQHILIQIHLYTLLFLSHSTQMNSLSSFSPNHFAFMFYHRAVN